MGRTGRDHSVWGCAPQEALAETVRGGLGGEPSHVNCGVGLSVAYLQEVPDAMWRETRARGEAWALGSDRHLPREARWDLRLL